MKWIVGFLVVVGQLGTQVPNGGIEGVIEDLGFSQGVPGVRVTLEPLEVQSKVPNTPFNTTSDRSGSFSFKSLSYGEYRITVERDGYFNPALLAEFGSRAAVATMTVAVTGGAPIVRARLALIRSGAVTGRVSNADGNALPQLAVGAFRRAYRYDGAITFSENWYSVKARGVTDDRGMYRISGLPPGQYYIGVLPSYAGPTNLRIFYPDAAEPRLALPVEVRPSEAANADIRVPSLPALTISGSIINMVPQSLSGTQRPGLLLVPRGTFSIADIAEAPRRLANTAPTSDQAIGKFELRNIYPGVYDLIAVIPSQLRNQFLGRTQVDIRDENLRNVTVRVLPGSQVRIRLMVSGNGSPFSPETVRPQLRPRENWPIPFETAMIRPGEALAPRPRGGEPSPPAPPLLDATGAFVFHHVAEGTYCVEVSGLPEDAYVDDLKQEGSSVSRGMVAITGVGTQEVQIVINTSGAKLEGEVLDAFQRRYPNAKVALVPEGASRFLNTGLYKATTTDLQGRFVLRGVAPGQYKLFAFDDFLPNSYLNPEFTAQYNSQGWPINISRSESGLRLKLILTRKTP